MADAVALQTQIPLVKSVSPNVDGSIQAITTIRTVHAVPRGVAGVLRHDAGQSTRERFSDPTIRRSAADVCAIGRTVRDQSFGPTAVGKVMRVSGMPCSGCATLQPKGMSVLGQDQDDVIIIAALDRDEEDQRRLLAGRH